MMGEIVEEPAAEPSKTNEGEYPEHEVRAGIQHEQSHGDPLPAMAVWRERDNPVAITSAKYPGNKAARAFALAALKSCLLKP